MSEKNPVEELNKILYSSIKNYSQPEVIEGLFFIQQISFFLAIAKGNHYQDSWCKRGLFSISQNLERKWDRVENLLFGTDETQGIMQGNYELLKGDETILESIMDLGIYCSLATVYFLLQGNKHNNSVMNIIFEKYYSKTLEFIDGNMPTQEQLNIKYKNLMFPDLGKIFNGDEKQFTVYAKIKNVFNVLKDKLRLK